MSIKVKATILIILIAIISSLVIVAGVGYVMRNTYIENKNNYLINLRDLQAHRIESYFDEIKADLLVLRVSPTVKDAVSELDSAFEFAHYQTQSGDQQLLDAYYNAFIDSVRKKDHTIARFIVPPEDHRTIGLQKMYLLKKKSDTAIELGDGLKIYQKKHNKFNEYFSNIKTRLELHDIILINTKGDIIYSEIKEIDFATNLFSEPFGQSNLTKLVKNMQMEASLDSILTVDFSHYFPSYGELESFFGAILEENGKVLGFIVVQVASSQIDDIMTFGREWEKYGLGKTGETYLVGRDRDLLSGHRAFYEYSKDGIDTTNDFNFAKKVDTAPVKNALEGISGTLIYTTEEGEETISAYRPLQWEAFKLGLIAESSYSETMAPLWIFLFNFSFVLAVITVLVIMISRSLISYYLMRPLHRLGQFVHEVGKGKLDEKLLVNTNDELSELAYAFNRMSASLKHNMATLKDEQQELEKVNAQLDSFVYSISHEIRAPLASIKGLINLSKNENSIEELKLLNERKESSLNRLDHYIGDILNYTRNARMEVEVSEINFNEMLESLFKQYDQYQGVDRKIQVNQKQSFFSDRMRIMIILNNLISNAIKYYNKDINTPFVMIMVTSRDNGVEIIVRDNGIGIEQKYLKKVFKMFFRASSHVSGSGLGLYIVSETLKKLSGEIDIESTPGEGTTIRLWLPDLSTLKR